MHALDIGKMKLICMICLGIEAYSNASFGIVSGPVHLYNVDCSGDESSLLNCTHSSKCNCTPITYAGVACSGENCWNIVTIELTDLVIVIVL